MTNRASWANWAQTYNSRPSKTVLPRSEEELGSAVKSAAAEGRRVKVVGTGHSFTDIARPEGVMVRLDDYQQMLSADKASGQAVVQAGIPIAKLNQELHIRGLALPNMGDVAYQTISGAISTATHGTGVRLRNISSQVVGMNLVLADGSVLSCSVEEHSEVFECARVGLGALGAISTITLQCVPSFNLLRLQERLRLDECLDQLDSKVNNNDHFEFFWFPHTDYVLAKTMNRTDEPARPKTRFESFMEDIVMENGVFGAMCKIGKLRPSSIPSLNRRTVGGIGRGRRAEASYKMFVTPRLVRFVEMEYAIPRENAAEAVRAVRSMIDDAGHLISFPIEVRFVAPDDIPLSTAFGKQTCYIAVHVYRGMKFEPYFRGVEEIMSGFDGRPHWGKMHFKNREQLAPLYPRWDDFQKVRQKLDPEGHFSNAYLDRVLGPVNS